MHIKKTTEEATAQEEMIQVRYVHKLHFYKSGCFLLLFLFEGP